MNRWVKLVLAILVAVGVLAARPGIAAPAKDMPHHQHCMEMAHEQDHSSDERGGVPTCCVAVVCAMVQTIFQTPHSIAIHLEVTQIALPLRDDFWRTGVRAPPNLRPPIA